MTDAALDDPPGMQHSRDCRHDPETCVIARRIAFRCLRLFFLFCAATGSAGAFSRAPDAPPAPVIAPDRPVFEVSRGGSVDVENDTLFVNRRRIVTFRATLLDDAPAARAQQAEATLERMLAGGGPAAITLMREGATASLKFDGERVFHLVADDVGPSSGLSFDAAGEEVQRRLQAAVLEVREKGDARRIGEGLAWAAGATLLALLLLKGVFWLRRKLAERLDRRLAAWQQDRSAGDLLVAYAEHARRVLNAVSRGLSWLAAVLLIDAWLTFVLHQFAWSRPWGERSTAWLLDVLAQFAWAIAGAIPGLVIAVLIFLLARFSNGSKAARPGWPGWMSIPRGRRAASAIW